MQGLQKCVVLAMALAWNATAYSAFDSGSRTANALLEPEIPRAIAERVERHVRLQAKSGQSSVLSEITAPGASFIKVHFSQFRLPPGVFVEIASPDGAESWRYSADDRDPFTFDIENGDDGKDRFSAMSITGDTAIISLIGKLENFNPDVHVVEIDSHLEGHPLTLTGVKDNEKHKKTHDDTSYIESDCGNAERYGAVCWAGSHPWEYDRSAAVAKLITSRGEVCTAWRVGQNNHMFTAEHCIGKQSELDGAEIWFNYEDTSCGSSQTTEPVKVTGGSLLADNRLLDYALFTVNNFSSIAGFPTFGLEVQAPVEGEEIWIPQHGLGNPRQIALESDMNQSGRCEVDVAEMDGYTPGADIGYYCDTTTSSSGSPVVSVSSGRVLALHHFGGCLNAGVRFSEIWPEVSGHFGGSVPGGSGGGASPPANQAPTAVFSAACDELSCSFDASGSSDADGEIAAYSWSLSDGGSASGLAFDHQFADEGLYSITLTVEDNEGSTDSFSDTVEVTLPNQSPTAKISTSCVDNSCEFDAGGSSDPDGEVLSYDWSFGDGQQASGVTQAHVYKSAGTYTVTLKVQDDDGAVDVSSHTLSPSMPNESPVAMFDFSCEELDCSFEAGGSLDPDGEVVSMSWTFGDGSTANGAVVSHSYASGGAFEVILTVRDDDDAESSAAHSVQVEPPQPNQPPEADFTYQCDELSCSFDASGSLDVDGQLKHWSWTFGDGGQANGPSVSRDYHADGTFTVTLVVEDDEGATDSRSRTVSVSRQEQPNQAPRASFSYSCDELACEFSAEASRDTDGSIVEMSWNFGDGQVASGQKVNHRFADNGTYEVVLTVRDNENASDSNSKMVGVEERAPEIKLAGQGGRYNGRSLAILSWTGAESTAIDIFRDGQLLVTTPNDGKHLDTELKPKMKSAAYRVCQAGTGFCSATLTLYFTP